MALQHHRRAARSTGPGSNHGAVAGDGAHLRPRIVEALALVGVVALVEHEVASLPEAVEVLERDLLHAHRPDIEVLQGNGVGLRVEGHVLAPPIHLIDSEPRLRYDGRHRGDDLEDGLRHRHGRLVQTREVRNEIHHLPPGEVVRTRQLERGTLELAARARDVRLDPEDVLLLLIRSHLVHGGRVVRVRPVVSHLDDRVRHVAHVHGLDQPRAVLEHGDGRQARAHLALPVEEPVLVAEELRGLHDHGLGELLAHGLLAEILGA
mmetsp:Transcript_19467/g.45016  ORF Transcript_19467/g.45016 Transcript_19467/m.45016 type:complete len:264 (-) Transcript_19467:603-1394(-)